MQWNCAEQEKLCVTTACWVICIISVNMLRFLFPGKESAEGEKPVQRNRGQTLALLELNPFTWLKSILFSKYGICDWMRLCTVGAPQPHFCFHFSSSTSSKLSSTVQSLLISPDSKRLKEHLIRRSTVKYKACSTGVWFEKQQSKNRAWFDPDSVPLQPNFLFHFLHWHSSYVNNY